MSKLDDIVLNAKAVILNSDGSIANYATMPEQDKQQIKDLMLMTYHKAVLQDGDTTDNFIKEVESL